ncbi:MAG: beta-ketoacyl-ACP synthase II [Firmicutes bacterium]|jgi:3-oxoacyl-[acyl-carrier-protein] synthase II|nr:beta-ketoacyl-ACP synthase II [Bacillota bacterium]MDH7494906.1 beta-ketoacyl-ACP synthase II [Bacillota bacterium]
MTERVVVTGLGVVTPIGIGREAFFDGLRTSRNGIGRVTRFDPSPFRTQMAGEVRDFVATDYMTEREAHRLARFTQFAVAAARLALTDAGLTVDGSNRDRVGVVMGCGIGGLEVLEEQVGALQAEGPRRVSPFFIPMMIPNMASGQVAIFTGARGPNITVSTACAAATNALGEAFRVIQRGDADVVLAGGAEAAITPAGFAGFCALRAMSRRNDEPEKACRPFDRGRDGFVMGEGSVVLVLERLDHALRRGADPYAEMVGYGASDDAHHIVEPDPEGKGALLAMQRALVDAGLSPADVDYINAHGTSTPLNDRCETMAIKELFGPLAPKVAISSTKSMTGHLLGAAGGVGAAACLFAISTGLIPATINYEDPDPECDLDYVPNVARKGQVDVAMCNSFGFGGHNGVLVLKRFDA